MFCLFLRQRTVTEKKENIFEEEKNGERKTYSGIFFLELEKIRRKKYLISEEKEGRSRKYRKMFGKRHLVIEEKKNIEGREGKYLGTKKLGEGWLDG